MNPVALGQHFLINKNIARKMVLKLLPAEGPILEIGPGKGVLTRLLISQGKKNDLVAVEKDKKLSLALHDELGGKIRVIQADILDIHLNDLFSGKRINLIGNIPYLISKKIINWIIREHEKIKKGVFMMQKEFVDKLVPPDHSFNTNAQSIMIEFLFRVRNEFDVSPGSFSPPPKVVSSVFAFQKRENRSRNLPAREFFHFLKRCFSNPRKTLPNNLNQHYGKQEVKTLFSKHQLNTRIRAQQLSLEDFVSLFQWMEKRLLQ